MPTTMSLKIKLKMRYVSRISTEQIIQQAEELINISKLGNKFNDNIFALRGFTLEKIECKIFLQKF